MKKILVAVMMLIASMKVYADLTDAEYVRAAKNLAKMPMVEISKEQEIAWGNQKQLDMGNGLFATVFPDTNQIVDDTAEVAVLFKVADDLALGGVFNYDSNDCALKEGIVKVVAPTGVKMTAWSIGKVTVYSTVAKYVCKTAWNIDITKP